MSQNDTPSLNIAAQPALGGRGGLLSLCVVDATSDVLRVATLDQETEPAKENSRQAIHGPKIFSKKRKTTNENARSADEAYHSPNGVSVASWEKLQSRNEELTDLNSRLRATFQRSAEHPVFYGSHNSVLHKRFISGAKNGQPVRRIAARIGRDPFAGSHPGLIQGKRRV